jgi:fructose-1-phosphate kinase PfkB-like protein
MKITILEFAPCADSIYHIAQDAEEGYISGDAETLALRSGAKLRPRAVSTYAGGKATNVARVIEKLLRPEDRVEVELVVFRPDSAEGRYIQELQTAALNRVQIRPALIRGKARFCIDLTDPTTPSDRRVEFNISPRALWEPDALEVAQKLVATISTDLLLMAGNPPVIEPAGSMAVALYAEIIAEVRSRVEVVSVDVEKEALRHCLAARQQPDVIKINTDEHRWAEGLWDDFRGTLVVTDAGGCLVSEDGSPPLRVPGASIEKLYSTIGAGDAAHAGFTLARWVWGFDLTRAARYGQAAAAATVSSLEGTRGVKRDAVEKLFAKIESEGAG